MQRESSKLPTVFEAAAREQIDSEKSGRRRSENLVGLSQGQSSRTAHDCHVEEWTCDSAVPRGGG